MHARLRKVALGATIISGVLLLEVTLRSLHSVEVLWLFAEIFIFIGGVIVLAVGAEERDLKIVVAGLPLLVIGSLLLYINFL